MIEWAYSRASTTGAMPEPRPLNADGREERPGDDGHDGEQPEGLRSNAVGSELSCTVLTHQGALDSES